MRITAHLPAIAFGFVAAIALFLITAGNQAMAADIFSSAKTTIKENADEDSGLFMAMLAVGLGSAALSGFITKNWGGAIGGFVVGMIFVNFMAGVIMP